MENVERVMVEEKLSPKEATEKSMSQIQGGAGGYSPWWLSAVFVRLAFFRRLNGAILIVSFQSPIVSAMAALRAGCAGTDAALCATLLKPASA
ncbi:efflux RND transporter permease subunit [Escherichia coli]|uniref:efflux RND transporter permease subunit n=1 Tax=Escherichia coli TaxID=562 RepID=UPI003AB976E1